MPAKLLPTLSDRLLRYTAIASAVTAGGVLSIPHAHASATVREINVTIDNLGAGDNNGYDFDFDLDGDAECNLLMVESLFVYARYAVPAEISHVYLDPLSYNGDKLLEVVYAGSPGNAAVVNYGAPINSSALWHAGRATLNHANQIMGNSGNWSPIEGHATDSTQGAYLGVSLQLDGAGPYYGWIELYYPDREHITIKRIGYGTVAGQALPASVDLVGAQAVNGWQAITAGAFAALGGVLTWIRRRMTNNT